MSTSASRARRNEVLVRSRHLMALGVQSGNRLFVPEQALLRQIHPTHPAYTGLVVAQTPLEYAIALLETGGDVKRANRIVRRTAEFQDRDPASPTYGNFIWMTHWRHVDDRNAVSFMTPNYAYLWRHHREKLDASTRKCLEAVFPLALCGVRAHRVPPAYTNIFLLNILSKFDLAAILGDRAAGREAQSDWDAWVAEVSRQGIAEYNSACYTTVDLYALEGILDAAPTESFRRQVEAVLTYVWTEFAVNYHAGIKCLSGPMSRAYPADYLYGNGLSGVIGFQQFGTRFASFDSNGGLTPFVVNYAMRHYVVPESIRTIALRKTWPVTVRGSAPERGITWVNYLTRDFTLGSQTGYYCSQEMPVFLAFRTRGKRRTLFFKSDPPTAVLSSAQDGGLLLGGFAYPQDVPWSRGMQRAGDTTTIRLYLGPAKALCQRIVRERRTVRGAAQVVPCRRVAVQLDSIFVGVKAFMAGRSGRMAGVVLERRGAEPSIVWRMGGRRCPSRRGAGSVAGFVLCVAEIGSHANLRAFARHMEAYAVTIAPHAGAMTLAVRGHDAALAVRVPPAKALPPEFLHRSPYLCLRPGELRAQVLAAGRAAHAQGAVCQIHTRPSVGAIQP